MRKGGGSGGTKGVNSGPAQRGRSLGCPPLAAEEHPPPSASPALHTAGHTRKGSPRLPKAVEDRREAVWLVEVGVIYFDGKKKKKRSNLITPPGTLQAAGARSPRGNTEVAAACSKGRQGQAWSEALGQ